MALHNTFGEFNRRGDTLPVVKYSATPYYFDFFGQNVIACWICKRTSSFDFEYFGMDEATAQQCADAMRDMYTRRYMRWTATVTSKDSTDRPNVVITPAYTFECTSEIQPRLVAGDNWSVTVAVRDEDTVISLEEPKSTADFARIFKLAEDRDTPIAIGSITILNASWRSDIDDGTVIAEYDAKILNFDESLLSVEVLTGGAWVTPETVRRSGGKVEFFADSNVTLRLTYSSGAVLSQEWTTTDPVRPPITITNVYIDEVESGTGNHTFFTNMYWTAEFETQLDTSRVLQIQSWDMMMTAGGRTYGNGSRDYLSTSGMKIEKIGVGKYRIRSGIILDTPPPAAAVGNAIITYRPFGIDSQAFVTTKSLYRISLDNVEIIDRIDEGDTIACVFAAKILTNGMSEEEIASNASMKLRDTMSVHGGIITPTSQTISKIGDGVFSVRAKFSGFNKSYTGKLYYHVGVSCGSSLFWILQFGFYLYDELEIVTMSQSGPASTAVTYHQMIDGFDADKLFVSSFYPDLIPNSFPSDNKWSYIGILSKSGNVIDVRATPRRMRLDYDPQGTSKMSKPKTVSGSQEFVDARRVESVDGTVSVEFEFDLDEDFDSSKLHVLVRKSGTMSSVSGISVEGGRVSFAAVDGADFYFLNYNDELYSDSFVSE